MPVVETVREAHIDSVKVLRGVLKATDEKLVTQYVAPPRVVVCEVVTSSHLRCFLYVRRETVSWAASVRMSAVSEQDSVLNQGQRKNGKRFVYNW